MKRFNVFLTERSEEILASEAKLQDESMATIIRLSLEVAKVVFDAERNGKDIRIGGEKVRFVR